MKGDNTNEQSAQLGSTKEGGTIMNPDDMLKTTQSAPEAEWTALEKTPRARSRTSEEIEQMHGTEMAEKRSANSKFYSLGESKYQAVHYMTPIHVQDRKTGEWKEIDNTFVEARTRSGDQLIKNNENGAMQLSLSATEAGPMVQIENDSGSKISWILEGAAKKRPVRVGKQKPLEEAGEVSESKHPMTLSMQKQRVLEKLVDEALYEEILPETDLRCKVDGTSFKDDVVFKSLHAAKPVSFLVETEGLSLVKQADGSMNVIDTQGEITYVMPAPFMLDSEERTGDVQVALASLGTGKWRLTYTPDMAWLQGASFPVAIDPEIKVSTSMLLKYVDSAMPNNSYNGGRIECSGSNRKLTYFKLPSIGFPDSSYEVTKAEIALYPTPSLDWEAYPIIYAKEVLSSWDNKVTYNTQPLIGEVDIAISKYEKKKIGAATVAYLIWDVSDLARKWRSGANHGVVLDARKSGESVIIFGGGTTIKCYLSVNYVSQAGLENYFTMESHDVGRAGTAHVNLLNGNLVFEHKDTVCTGARLPVSISHYYNACHRNVYSTEGTGFGWKHSLDQRLEQVDKTENDVTTTEFRYTDGDGTEHNFAVPEGSTLAYYYDQSGLSLKATASTVKDKLGNTISFSSKTISHISNLMGDKITLNTTTQSAGSGKQNVTTTVKDGKGRSTLLKKYREGSLLANTRMEAIEAPGVPSGKGVRFSYNAGKQLTSITHEDDAVTTYTYDSQNLLTSATNVDGRTLTIEYYDTAPFRVKRITEASGDVIGNSREYQYGNLVTTVIDRTVENGKRLSYHFNDNGNLTSVSDMLGNATVTTFSPEKPINHADTISKMQRAAVNLLRNHSFERSTDWVFEGTVGYASTGQKIGSRCLCFSDHYYSGLQSAAQTVGLEPGKTYTLSFYGRRCGHMTIRPSIQYLDAGGMECIEEGASLLAAAGDEYERASYTFTLPADAFSGEVTVKLTGESALSEVSRLWIDCIQLEEGKVAGNYSLLLNGDFIYSVDGKPENWIMREDSEAADRVVTLATEGKPQTLSPHAMHIEGNCFKKAGFYQELSISGHAGDAFVAGGWANALSRPHSKLRDIPQSIIDQKKKQDLAYRYRMEKEESNPETAMLKNFGIRVAFKVRSGDYISSAPIYWSDEWTDWRFACGPVIAPDRYTAVRFYVDYEENINWAEFGGLFLYKEQYGKSFDYDGENNVVSVETFSGLKSSAEYDTYDNLISYRRPGRPEWQKVILEYDPDGAYDTSGRYRTGASKHLLYKVISPDGIIQKYTRDDKGNRTSAKTSSENSDFPGFFMGKTEYSTDQNYAIKETDARGKVITRDINLTTGVLNGVTNPEGQKITHQYDELKRVTATTTTADEKTYRNEYTYANDKLTQVRHNTGSDTECDVVYNFEYDALGNPTETKVGTQRLSALTYSETGDKLLKRMDYGNGGSVQYEHDEFKRVVAIRHDDEPAPRYTYSHGVDGQVAKLEDHHLGRTVVSEYDLAQRTAQMREYEGDRLLYAADMQTDAYNRAASLRETVKGRDRPYETRYAYDSLDRLESISFGAENTGVMYRYDALGRVTARELSLESGEAYTTEYSYLAGGHGANSTTAMVEALEQPGHELAYVYDDNGNITKETHNGDVTSYGYDKLGQLTRVNDARQGKSFTYAYDRGGNILSKSEYAYAEGTGMTGLGVATKTVAYTYGDANWRDKLTAYDGVAITYDANGNPLNDGNWAYTWETGRMLTRMCGTGVHGGAEDVSFTYNAAGLRVRKDSSTSGTTEYILNGKQIVHLKSTPIAGDPNQEAVKLHFWYDAQGKPSMVSYKGKQYGYVQNLQGDVIAILDGQCNQVVEYRYDAWGKLVSCTGTMAGTLGRENPFRYRGYAFDEETGLYYLRSRYYNPSWGRFINADTMLGQTGKMLSHNAYAYCRNNAVCMHDTEGMIPFAIPFAVPLLSEGTKYLIKMTAVIGSMVGAFFGALVGTSSSRPSTSSTSSAHAKPQEAGMIKATTMGEATQVLRENYDNDKFWEASVESSAIWIGKPISKEEGIVRVLAGGDVFAVNGVYAHILAYDAAEAIGGKIYDEFHDIPYGLQLWHYHIVDSTGNKLPSHILSTD